MAKDELEKDVQAAIEEIEEIEQSIKQRLNYIQRILKDYFGEERLTNSEKEIINEFKRLKQDFDRLND